MGGPSATQGSVELDPLGMFVFTPTAGFVGTATFTYAVSDGSASKTATVSVAVTNAAPTAVNRSYTESR
jgi:hypothetical protein